MRSGLMGEESARGASAGVPLLWSVLGGEVGLQAARAHLPGPIPSLLGLTAIVVVGLAFPHLPALRLALALRVAPTAAYLVMPAPKRTLVGLAVVALGLLVVWPVVAGLQRLRGPTPWRQRLPQPQDRVAALALVLSVVALVGGGMFLARRENGRLEAAAGRDRALLVQRLTTEEVRRPVDLALGAATIPLEGRHFSSRGTTAGGLLVLVEHRGFSTKRCVGVLVRADGEIVPRVVVGSCRKVSERSLSRPDAG